MSLDPMDTGEPPLPSTFFRPRESERGIYTEKKLGDEMLAIWETTDLPPDAEITHVTLIPYRGDRAVVAWRAGQLSLPEGDVLPGEELDAAIRRIALDQAGILDPTAKHLGHFRARATSLSKTRPAGTITYQALHGVEVGGIADFPADGAYERRIILQRDLNVLLRTSYVEMRREYTDTLDRYLIERLKANLREG